MPNIPELNRKTGQSTSSWLQFGEKKTEEKQDQPTKAGPHSVFGSVLQMLLFWEISFANVCFYLVGVFGWFVVFVQRCDVYLSVWVYNAHLIMNILYTFLFEHIITTNMIWQVRAHHVFRSKIIWATERRKKWNPNSFTGRQQRRISTTQRPRWLRGSCVLFRHPRSHWTTRWATATPVGDPHTSLGEQGVGAPLCGRMHEMNNQRYWVHSSPADSKFTERKLTLAHKHLSQGPRGWGDTRAKRKARQMDQEQRSRREIHYEILCLPRAHTFFRHLHSHFPGTLPLTTTRRSCARAPPCDSWLVPLFYMSS